MHVRVAVAYRVEVILRNVRLDDGAFHLSEFIYYFNSPYHELIGRWELGVGCDLGFLPNV